MGNFKVVKRREGYFVTPPYEMLVDLENKELPIDTNEIIYQLFNFDLISFYKYIIIKYEAVVAVRSTFPYFVFYFTKEKANLFAKELDERAAYKFFGGANHGKV